MSALSGEYLMALSIRLLRILLKCVRSAMIVRSSGAMSRLISTGLPAFSLCCSMSVGNRSCKLSVSGCRRKVLRRSILMERICSTSPLNRCNCSWQIPRYLSRCCLSSARLKLSKASLAAYATAIGVFNSWVMLLVKSLFISSSVFCRKMVRIRNQKEKPNIIRITNDVVRIPLICRNTIL